MISESQDELVLDGYVYKAEQSMFGCRGCAFFSYGIYADVCGLKSKQITYCQSNQRNDKRYIIWFGVGRVH